MSTTFKGTAGKWFAVEYNGGIWHLQSMPDYENAINLLDSGDTSDAEENAKLAAFAPEMLELLENLLDKIDWTGNTPMLNKVNELIQKATI